MSRILEHDWFPGRLPPNVEIGERSWLYSSYAFVHCRSRRPRAVRLGHDTGMYDGFFELGPEAEVDIGSFCTLVGVIIRTDRRVVIGDYSFLAHEVVLADTVAPTPPRERGAMGSCDAGEYAPGETNRPSIVLGENVWIGARAILLSGACIGDGAIVGAGAVIDTEVPPHSIAAGNPGRIVRRGRR